MGPSYAYEIVYNDGNKFDVGSYCFFQKLPSVFYCRTEKIANQIIKELEEEYKTYLGVEE